LIELKFNYKILGKGKIEDILNGLISTPFHSKFLKSHIFTYTQIQRCYDATAAQTATAVATTKRDSLASRLALTEAKVEKLCAAAASAEEAAERARTTAAATKTAARDTAQAVAHEKATLEARVSELERDLGTATMDLATVGRQFSQVSK
jgi:phage-related minor tail protein